MIKSPGHSCCPNMPQKKVTRTPIAPIGNPFSRSNPRRALFVATAAECKIAQWVGGQCPPPQTYFQSIGKCIFFTPPEGPARSGDGSSMAPSLSLPGKKCKPKSIRNGTNRVALFISNPHDILSCKCHVFRYDNFMQYCLNMKVI